MAHIFESKFSIRAILSDTSSKIDEDNRKQSNNHQKPGANSSDEETQQRPPYTYSALIVMAIRSTPNNLITLNEMCHWIAKNFPFFKLTERTWQNSIRHNLSINRCFVKVARPMDNPGRGNYWTLDPSSENVTIGESTGRLRQSEPMAGGPYNFQHFHHHQHMHYMPSEPYPIYFQTPEELMFMQQTAALQEEKMWYNYHIFQQQQHHNMMQHYGRTYDFSNHSMSYQ